MTGKRAGILMALCGLIIVIAAPLCHAREPGMLLDVKVPQAAVSPAFVPEITKTSAVEVAEVKPAMKTSGPFWYWRFLEMIAIGAAKYNTDKQSEGRPDAFGNFR